MNNVLDTRWLRNVANFGRGSAMTEALHQAADEIYALRTLLEEVSTCGAKALPDGLLSRIDAALGLEAK